LKYVNVTGKLQIHFPDITMSQVETVHS